MWTRLEIHCVHYGAKTLDFYASYSSLGFTNSSSMPVSTGIKLAEQCTVSNNSTLWGISVTSSWKQNDLTTSSKWHICLRLNYITVICTLYVAAMTDWLICDILTRFLSVCDTLPLCMCQTYPYELQLGKSTRLWRDFTMLRRSFKGFFA